MNKTKLKAWVAFLSLVVLLLSVLSGLILYKVLPRTYYFLGTNRYHWTQFHYYSALLFLFLAGIRIALHWHYFKNLPQILRGK